MRVRGALLAEALATSWRNAPSPLAPVHNATVELAIRSGAGALLERRLAISGVPREPLRNLLRHQVLEAARFEYGLRARVAALEEAGIATIVVKGWSVACRYPAKGLRHYSDLDLVIDRSRRAAAQAVLARFESDRLDVDLHYEVPHVAGRDLVALRGRLQKRTLGDRAVTTLGDEDHLWLLALHALGHGLWRSVWLVDLAVLLEDRAASLDWDYLLRGPTHDARAVQIALQLAHRVLGMRIEGTPVGSWPALPRWIEPALLEQWGEGFRSYKPAVKLPRLTQLWSEAARRWPNAIRATASNHGPWDERPRLPLQVLDFGKRLARFVSERDATTGIWAR